MEQPRNLPTTEDEEMSNTSNNSSFDPTAVEVPIFLDQRATTTKEASIASSDSPIDPTAVEVPIFLDQRAATTTKKASSARSDSPTDPTAVEVPIFLDQRAATTNKKASSARSDSPTDPTAVEVPIFLGRGVYQNQHTSLHGDSQRGHVSHEKVARVKAREHTTVLIHPTETLSSDFDDPVERRLVLRCLDMIRTYIDAVDQAIIIRQTQGQLKNVARQLFAILDDQMTARSLIPEELRSSMAAHYESKTVNLMNDLNNIFNLGAVTQEARLESFAGMSLQAPNSGNSDDQHVAQTPTVEGKEEEPEKDTEDRTPSAHEEVERPQTEQHTVEVVSSKKKNKKKKKGKAAAR